MEVELTNIALFLIGVVSSLFIFSSILLSKICEDEKSNYKGFILIAKISIIIVSLITILIYKELLSLGILLLIYFVAEIIITHFSSFKELKQYYVLRSLNYIVMYILLLTQPFMILLIVSYEFFRTTFRSFKPRFEVLLFVGYVLTLLFVFLL